MAECKRDGCVKPVRANGWCMSHNSTWYQQQRRAAGIKNTRFSDSDWTEETYADFWEFVKKELKLV